MEYSLTRSKRKTISLTIGKNAELLVSAPLFMPKSTVDTFVKSKERWILEHTEIQRERLQSRAGFSVNYGDSVLFLGNEYSVAPCEGNLASFDGTQFLMPSGLPEEAIKRTLIKLYMQLAKKIIPEKVKLFSGIMGVYPQRVSINSAKTRWGSMSGAGNVNFSWRLILAPESVVEYLVVHELSHMLEPNHSKAFWAIVYKYCPDYKARQTQLKNLERKLSHEDWSV